MRQPKSPKQTKAYQSPFLSGRGLTVFANNIGVIAFMAVTCVAIMGLLASRTSTPPSAIGHEVHQEIRVIDGDTLDLNGRRIRLYGIDAPEQGQSCTKNGESYDCGEASKQYLTYLLTGETLHCNTRATDKWGREVATCTAGSNDIAKLMVRHGWAVAYTEYSTDYVDDEQFARINGLGMWAKDFVLPKDWRNKSGNQ